MVTEHLSYTGATIFWLYNLLALLLTGIVIYTIYELPGPSGTNNLHRNNVATRFFVALSMISFSVLSTNMLNVLIQSFAQYRTNLSDFEIRYPDLFARLYHWSLTTPLFHDFGEAILANPARCLWTQVALFATFWVCLFMASKGRQLRMPRLWAFFALSQILPISFAQNLFYLALLRLPQPKPDKMSKQISGRKGRSNAEYQIAAIVLVYSATLLYAPRTVGSQTLMPAILLARALLLSPLMFANWHSEKRDSLVFVQSSGFTQSSIIGITVLIAGQAREAILRFSLMGAVKELTSHPAVSALGMDLVLCAFSSLAWVSWGRGAFDA